MSTRRAIMRAAERLYAEEGFAGVSVRRVGEAAGQRNKSAVQYHFASREDLVAAVLAEHAAAIEAHRLALVTWPLARLPVGELVRCVVAPRVRHHVELGSPSWYGRFLAQVVVEPSLREQAIRVHLETPTLRALYDEVQARRSLDAVRRAQREAMIRQLIVHMCAEQEAAGADAASWQRLGDHLTQAVTALVTL
ncbi:MAG: helix-turn-helix transcriptional regulator [Nonomuraea sp.]|nr:helix-turn-helix transcriptional regulator [Nonomuraea sp.]